jgi:hypothetical protein
MDKEKDAASCSTSRNYMDEVRANLKQNPHRDTQMDEIFSAPAREPEPIPTRTLFQRICDFFG